jgi:hypothetical protein
MLQSGTVPISAAEGQAAISQPTAEGSATATFADKLAALPITSNIHGSTPLRCPSLDAASSDIDATPRRVLKRYRVTVDQMTRRLTRELAGQPPQGRWADPPPLPELSGPDRRGKVLELLAAQPWRAWKGAELAAILGIKNINSFRVQLSQWSRQGHINKIGPALYGSMPTST